MSLLTSLSLLLLASTSFADVVPKNKMMIDFFAPDDSSSMSASRLQPADNVATTNWMTNTFYEGSGCTGSIMMTQAISTAFCYPTSSPTEFYTYSRDSCKNYYYVL